MKRKVLGGSLLIAGTTIGAGMLGIPLLTARAGFVPAFLITVAAWGILLWTGLLFMEVTLWMPEGSNLLSMSRRFFGKRGSWFSGAMFLFLYYCLLVAYFAAGVPLFTAGIESLFGLVLTPFWGNTLYAFLFGTIVFLGARWVDRANILLTAGLVLTYIWIVGLGAPLVDGAKLLPSEWNRSLLALPILFSAFGYHNIIPPLSTYLKREEKPLRLSIWIGTLIPLVVYLLWQWLVIGIIPVETIESTLLEGLPITGALSSQAEGPALFLLGQAFAFFAIITSFIGVSFSVVDFLADGMKTEAAGWPRVGLCALTFLPPLVFAMAHPEIFDKALGLAGGIGEAVLNGLIPIALIWVGRYSHRLEVTGRKGGSSKGALTLAALAILMVIGIELYILLSI